MDSLENHQNGQSTVSDYAVTFLPQFVVENITKDPKQTEREKRKPKAGVPKRQRDLPLQLSWPKGLFRPPKHDPTHPENCPLQRQMEPPQPGPPLPPLLPLPLGQNSHVLRRKTTRLPPSTSLFIVQIPAFNLRHRSAAPCPSFDALRGRFRCRCRCRSRFGGSED